MGAIIYQAANQVEIKDFPKPELKEGWALIKVRFAGICGTDLNILAGTHPRAKGPLVMGHEAVGILESDNVPGIPKGSRVTFSPLLSCGKCTPCKTGDSHVCNTLRLLGIDADGAFAPYIQVPAENVILIEGDVSDKLATLAEPVAVAVHALRDTHFAPGDNALIFGCGPIGLCLAITLREFGATRVLLMETDPTRSALAESMGFEVADPTGLDVAQYCKDQTGGDGFDWVYDCAGVQPVADLLLDAVKVRGHIVVVAAYKKPASLPLIKGMFKEVSMSFVRVYRLKDFAVAVKLIANCPDFEKLITHVLSPDSAKEGFDLLNTPGTGAVKILFDFTG